MLNLLRPAALLIALVTLDSSLASAQAAKAGVVTTLEGNVNVTRVTLAPQPLKFKDAVFVNDRVTTGDQSIARMLLGGNAVVTVRERSTLTITEVPGKTTIDLDAGKIALAVARDRMKAGESIEVRTANAVALLYIPVLLYSGSLSDSADRAISSVQDRKYRKYPSSPAWAWLAAAD